jgi:hypothetical protein
MLKNNLLIICVFTLVFSVINLAYGTDQGKTGITDYTLSLAGRVTTSREV